MHESIYTNLHKILRIFDPFDQRDGFNAVFVEQHLATVSSFIIYLEF